jgi:GT2 family glycosyltransferase
MQERRIYIIILNWNNAEETIQCLDNVISSMEYAGNQKTLKFHVIVIDNNSTDNSLTEIRSWLAHRKIKAHELTMPWQNDYIEKFSELKNKQWVLLLSDRNRGYAGGNNFGLEFANKMGCDYVLILNNDTLLIDKSLNAMIDFIEIHSEVGILGPVISDLDTRMIQSAGKKIDLWFGRHAAYRETVGEYREVGYVSGCCMLIRCKVLESAGLLDPDFCLYTEDVDFCYRVKKAGYKIICLNSAKAYHSSHGSIKGSEDREALRLFFQIRNNFLFSRKHLSMYRRSIYQTGIAARAFKRIFINLYRGYYGAVKSIINGLVSGLAGAKGCPWER